MHFELSLPRESPGGRIANAVIDIVLQVPPTRESSAANPGLRAKEIARAAARSASLTAASLSLPPGVLGWLTVLPELMAVWKIQTQMVADIAGAYGQTQTLGREQMLFCLFKQVAAQLVRDLVIRVGERVLVRPLSNKVLQTLAQKLGAQLTRSLVQKGASRLIPLLGALGVGAYAYADTLQVGRNAVLLFDGVTLVQTPT